MKYKTQLRDLTTYVQRRVMEFRQQQPSPAPQLMPTERQFIAASQAQPYQPVHTAQPQPLAAVPTDYYVDDNDHGGAHVLRGQVGHVAHLVGSAAMLAAHPAQHLNHRPINPYTQGSLMTRRPMSAPTQSQIEY